MGFTAIDQVLSKKFSNSAISKKITASLVCEEFDKLMLKTWGEKIKNKAQTMYLKDEVLTIACLSPVISQELKLREKELINKINQKFNTSIAEKLRLLV
ncbi:MAG: DciA family protein [Candidatus Kuenenbacteria bacterium]